MKYIKIGWGAFQVAEDFIVQTNITGYDVHTDLYTLTPDGKLYVSKYYAWDGPTGAFNTKSFVKGSCIHDIFCEMINQGLLPKAVQCMADEEMLIINRRQKMFWLRRAWTYAAVRFHMIKKTKPDVKKVYEVM